MKKILYLKSFTVKKTDFNSSDAVGYGITSSEALFQALKNNYQLIPVPTSCNEAPDHSAYLEWTLISYQEIFAYLTNDPPDAIFIFHSFQQFPQELKKMLYHLKLNIPIIGYTHGSHWDPTDTFRQIHCPDLHLTDLANLYCLDAILFVTDIFKKTVLEQVAQFNALTAERLAKKSFVVGLPINKALIDSFATKKKSNKPSIVFNHAPVPSKNLSWFLTVIEKILPIYPELMIYITRHASPGSIEAEHAHRLSQSYPGQIVLKKTLPIADYYPLLWEANIQVSTASHESLGVATLEAMYTKNCCILPKIGAYPEISQGLTEHLYENENELIQKLMFYIENPEQRQHLGWHLSKAAEQYTMPYLYQNFINVIDNCIEQCSAPNQRP